ncbi:hypothetical protein ACFP81_06300 [Deinococcus lacus]|uniref:Uncharacterized protein n=1 Tax=Deinococcus lacus TaxID=392561 RepID=A0ABW1YBU6_9DEIO
MTLEHSETDFAERYADYAAQGWLWPQVEGSPLLEFECGGHVLYLLDRCGPYHPREARVVVHGVLDMTRSAPVPPGQRWLESHRISGVCGCGEVLAAWPRLVAVDAGVPLVLGSLDSPLGLRPGDWLEFVTQPPLHGFVLGKSGAPET